MYVCSRQIVNYYQTKPFSDSVHFLTHLYIPCSHITTRHEGEALAASRIQLIPIPHYSTTLLKRILSRPHYHCPSHLHIYVS